MAFMDELKNAGKLALNKSKEFGDIALKKGKELGNTAKTNLDIVGLESEIETLYKKIGKIIFEEEINCENDEVKKLCYEIKAKKQSIEDKKKSLENNGNL